MGEETVGIKLVAQDMASGPLARVQGELRGLGGAAGGIASSGLGILGRAAGGVERGLGHLKSTIGGLVTGPLGFLGLTAGILGVGGALKTGIDTLNSTALAIEKLKGLTGEDAAAMSGLLAVTGKFNISADQLGTLVGFETKTLGKLSEQYVSTAAAGKSAALQSLEIKKAKLEETGASTKAIDALIKEQKARDAVAAASAKQLPPENKLQALQKQYGVILTDSKGQALSFSQVLNNVSDYYQTNATAGQKAALASTVFGRGYSVLIPVLKLGSKGFAEAQAAAASLGLTLNDSNEQQLMQYQETMRTLGDAVSGLELQLSLKLIPALMGVAKTATGFIRDHSDDILGFFSTLIADSQKAAGFITGTIIPDIQALAGAAVTFWNLIPAPLKTLLIGGLVTDRVMKFLFGFDPLTSIGTLIGKQMLAVLGLTAAKAGLGGVAGGLLQRGSSELNPMWVKMVGGLPGTGSGVPPVVEETGAGGGGLLATLVEGLGPLAVAAAVPLILNALINGDPTKTGLDDLRARQQIAAGRGLDPTKVATPADMAGGRRSSALPPGMSPTSYGAYTGTASQDVTSAIKEAVSPMSHGLAAISPLIASINKLAFIEQERLNAHRAAKKDVGGSGKAFHDFLLELRGGKIATAIKDFPKELAYIQTASDAQKQTPTTIRGVNETIKALERDMVGATDAQKRVLSADIKALRLSVNVDVAVSRNSLITTVNHQNVYGHSAHET